MTAPAFSKIKPTSTARDVESGVHVFSMDIIEIVGEIDASDGCDVMVCLHADEVELNG